MSSIVAHHKEQEDNVTFGFWLYLMTDLLMFAVLFACYIVLSKNTFGGVGIKDITDAPFVLAETMILLASSFTCSLALLFAKAQKKAQVLGFLLATLILGLLFFGMEIYEFSHLFSEGHTPQVSAFFSSYFTLLGTHGLHILIGCIWLVMLIIQIGKKGLTVSLTRKLGLAGLFWHFLDVVWIFIFTIVYLLGIVS